MLYNSYDFIFLFFPLVLLLSIFFKNNKNYFITLLIVASLLFYSYGIPSFLILLVVSIVVNFFFSIFLNLLKDNLYKNLLLWFSISFNILILFYYKYSNFFIQNFSYFFKDFFTIDYNLILPLGISFFTFQQIGYIVDIYLKKHEPLNFQKYFLFVSFFPQLIVGPIMRCSHFIKQMKKIKISKKLVTIGFTIFIIGLAKKIIIADRFAPMVNYYFGSIGDPNFTPGFLDSWIASLSYTFQLYFDFSGYMDMAMGIALCFNIVLPLNFYSPYKSYSIIEFWRRWHISLGQFFRDYLYIPLGGNKKLPIMNLFLTMFLVGLWHGAGWTFILWGVGHGLVICIDRLLKRKNNLINIITTFLIVSLLWVIFRSNNLSDALLFYSNLFIISDHIFVSENLSNNILYGRIEMILIGFIGYFFNENVSKLIFWIVLIAFSLVIVLFFPNTSQIFKNYIKFNSNEYRFSKPLSITNKIRFKYSANKISICITCFLFLVCFILLKRQIEFLYFQF